MNQLFAAYSRGKDAKELMTILGEAALTEIDLKYAEFAEAFEKEYVSQGYDNDRSIEEITGNWLEIIVYAAKSRVETYRRQILRPVLWKAIIR